MQPKDIYTYTEHKTKKAHLAMRPQILPLYPKPHIAALSQFLLIQVSPANPTSMPCVCMLPHNHSMALNTAHYRRSGQQSRTHYKNQSMGNQALIRNESLLKKRAKDTLLVMQILRNQTSLEGTNKKGVPCGTP
ncbi:hypothetical protein ACIQW9_13815 [Herminiimonas sp. NPDC097707]|uniref:hypothetical protein n=1 Tax=Herminiimonas sp. NPDC097707 TaxID=3364007 RepID=UPI00383BC098